VSLTPASVKILVDHSHDVYVQSMAGDAIGFTDNDYLNSGAVILNSAKEVFESTALIVKVKEPMPEEFQYINETHTLFTYLHLAGEPEQAAGLVATGATGIAYETVTADDGSMPLLAPMSAIAGQLSVIVGSYHLLKPNQGMGTLIGAFGDLQPRNVTVIGAGIAGTEAIDKAISNKAYLKIIDLSEKRLKELEVIYGNKNVEYILSTESAINDAIKDSDLVIGAVYVVGKQAPKVINNGMLANMKPGAVMVDISIDQGGCFESSKPTTHDNPTYLHNGVLHYCVTNMPGAVPLTATEALNKATLSYVLELADKGIEKALNENIHLANGLNIKNGKIVHDAVREALAS
jgi:alanine dehydrogenase